MTPMKITKQKTRRKLATVAALIAVAAIAVLAVAALVASIFPKSVAPAGGPPPAATEATTTPPGQKPVPDTDENAVASAYEALIGFLQDEILTLKEEAFITKSEYQARIEALEKALAAANSPDSPGDIPVSGTPDTEHEPTDSPADTTEVFRYAVRDGSVTILAYTGSSLHVTIPSHVGELPVTRIGENAFRASAVKTVAIPDTVTEIDWFAFADNPSLTTVTIPASVTAIGYGAFDATPSLTLITPKDSYAEAFAVSFGLPHKDE